MLEVGLGSWLLGGHQAECGNIICQKWGLVKSERTDVRVPGL